VLDLKLVLEKLPLVRESLQRRNAAFDLSSIEKLNQERKALQKEFDDLRFQQNQIKKPTPDDLVRLKKISERVKEINEKITGIETQLRDVLLQIPNIPHQSVPVGPDASANVGIRQWGKIPTFSFKPKEHYEIGEALGILDFERGAKIAGARFTLYKGTGAALERALASFMIDLHVGRGYTEILPPFMVNAQSLLGTGQLPKFEADLFKTTAGLYLIPTAEVPVTNMYRDEILALDQLTLSYVAYSPCFRSEAGAAGKDTRGLIRQHQFNKVELVKFSKPEESYEQLEKLTADAEEVLKKLELPYRTMLLCTGDMGFASAKTYDIEVWFPSQKAYREISSCSNFEDFQARRANIRFRRGVKDKPEFVHTLNGSGLAVGRTVAAILENFQNADGSVNLPKVLQPYFGSRTTIG
jgi:seryl-tRNA synthetase